jgi:hypothetical protein
MCRLAPLKSTGWRVPAAGGRGEIAPGAMRGVQIATPRGL